MKLVAVTVENFRSITAARRIQLSGLTTLVGPNNEGKSNILRAIVFAMRHLADERAPTFRITGTSVVRVTRRSRDGMRYEWVKDCPLKLQKTDSNGSKITLEFELTLDEVTDFFTEVGSRLNGTLPICISFSKNNTNIAVVKPGRGGKALSTKAPRVAKFLARKIDIQYIPAVRTAGSALKIVEDLVARELATVETDSKYQQALADIAALQQPVLEELSRAITGTMKGFLPNIKQARITIPEQERNFALRGISSIFLDDGVETELGAKGDGVQSLAALALMRHSSQARNEGKEILIALEEPESHLHPGAIRQLRAVLTELSVTSQIVLTTHNPIFTNRDNVAQNIIVEKNRAYAAKTVKEVRDILGVRLDDNLTSAELILIVEGEEDKIVILPILRTVPLLAEAVKNGRLAVDVLAGAGNLSHRVRLHTENICKVHALLDNDAAGRTAFQLARDEHLLTNASVNLTSVGGKPDSELEDLYDESVYQAILKAESGLDWVAYGPDANKKWSDRVKNLLRRAGKSHDELDIMAIKIRVAKAAAGLGFECLHKSKTGPIDSLLTALVLKLQAPAL